MQTTNVYYSRQINSLACSREVKLHNHICFDLFFFFEFFQAQKNELTRIDLIVMSF
ncbi:unnamed protein product [Callosobruchus maculatus]|uniref:Uncharacterized protein n=1 Tax=Callosobruchus maculatus TaxID=64391 RepID=A0A653DH61_CALMS|nr:unnamed protein product [Callosobruchus maculatus]